MIFADRGRGGASLQTVICRGCGLVHTNPLPSEKEIAEFYHHQYWGSYKGQTAPGENFFQRRIPKVMPIFKQLVPRLTPGARVLEVGTSVGALLSLIHRQLAGSGKVVGIEAHEGHAKFAREQKGLDVRYGLLDEVAGELHGMEFDLAVMNHVLEHTLSPSSVLTILSELVRQDGVLVLEVPNVEAPGATVRNFFHLAHPFNFSPMTLRRLARKTGWGIELLETPDGDLPDTRLNATLVNLRKPADAGELLGLREDAEARRDALERYFSWYGRTLGSFRKKWRHWQRHASGLREYQDWRATLRA